MRSGYCLTLLFAGLAASVSAASQDNLDRTVSITNSYETSVPEALKKDLDFCVPDSLLKFDCNFDYSVFDTPYNGAFEFSPYAVRVIPEPSAEPGNVFFLRAGAGYGLHPQLQAVWAPRTGKNFNISVLQDFHGYAGLYRTVRTDATKLVPLGTTKGVRHFGYDLSERFAVRGDAHAKKFDFGFEAGYEGLFNQDEIRSSLFNSLALKACITNSVKSDFFLVYKVSLSGIFSSDVISHQFENSPRFTETAFDLSGFVGPALKDKRFSAHVEYDLEYAGHSDRVFPNRVHARVAPKVCGNFGIFRGGIGVSFSGATRLVVAPVLDFTLQLFKNSLNLYGDVTGGSRLNTYYSLKNANQWFFPGYSAEVEPSRDIVDAKIGLRGSMASRLHYDVSGGYRVAREDAAWGLKMSYDGVTLMPTLAKADYNVAYADVDLGWKSERLDVDGALHFRKPSYLNDAAVFGLPMFSGTLNATYNIRKRIYFGVDFSASSARRCTLDGKPFELQAFADLGVHGEWRYSNLLTFWLKGSNLLNESAHVLPMHIENGISFTAGVILHL